MNYFFVALIAFFLGVFSSWLAVRDERREFKKRNAALLGLLAEYEQLVETMLIGARELAERLRTISERTHDEKPLDGSE